MPSFVKTKTKSGLLPSMALVALGILASGNVARACEGTICDLVGSNNSTPSASAPSAAPTPLTVPSSGGILGFFKSKPSDASGATASSQSESNSLLNVQGGGLATAFTSPSSQRCSGTFCDFFYRGAPPESAPQQPAAQQATASARPVPASTGATRTTSTTVVVEQPREKPLCHSATDPWHCFR